MNKAIRERYDFITHGDNVFIAKSAYVDKRAPIKIGSHVTICDWVKILTHDYSPVTLGGQEEVAGIEIGDNVFIGIQAIILPGTKIGSNIIVGAGAVVSKSIEEPGIYAGNPIKKIR